MLKKYIYNKVIRYLPYYLRKKTDHKIVVIESDDWGLERALTPEAIEWAISKYGKDNFTRWTTDSLETAEDLKLLFDLFANYKGDFKFAPVITANFITHNINYQIDSNITFRSIEDTIKINNPELYNMYLEGIKNNFLRPQLHGFCHYNLTLVSEYFQSEEGREGFKNKFFLAKPTIRNHTSCLEGECTVANRNYEAQLISAQEVFFKTFGFYSETFIPPRFIIDSQIIKLLKKNHIEFLQSGNRLINSSSQRYYIPYYRRYLNQVWLNRNCRLDPHKDYGFNAEQCIYNINAAFENKQPAVIDFHRVNISGKYTPEYRNKSNDELNKVLNYLKIHHPVIIFTTSDKLLNCF